MTANNLLIDDTESQDIIRHNIDQAPVPLSIFRSNSKFDENSKQASVKYTHAADHNDILYTSRQCHCRVSVEYIRN